MPNQIAFYPQSAGTGGGSLTLLGTVTVATTGPTVTFSGIPQTYNNLKIIGSFQEGGGGSNLVLQLNGDTAAHYSESYVYGNNGGASAAGGGASGQTSSIIAIGTSGSIVVDISSYHGSAFSTTYFTSQGSAPLFNSACGGSWAGTGVTSVTIFDLAGANFSVGSTFYLYGY